MESDRSIFIGLQSSPGNSVVDGQKFLIFDHFIVDVHGRCIESGDLEEQNEICYHFNIIIVKKVKEM